MFSLDYKLSWLKSQIQEIATALRPSLNPSDQSLVSVPCYLKWEPPLKGWVILNTDGCCKLGSQMAGGGGVLRNMHGYRQLVVAMDSDVIVKWLLDGKESRMPSMNLLYACKKLLSHQWKTRVIHGYREQNRVADHLASAAIQQDWGLQILNTPPPSIQQILWEDENGVRFRRRVPVVRA
ncbi:hypothetical protein DITRI_Ditri14bG0034300 [Diplodiscus trichospermus]